jgi:hypothetical protein
MIDKEKRKEKLGAGKGVNNRLLNGVWLAQL